MNSEPGQGQGWDFHFMHFAGHKHIGFFLHIRKGEKGFPLYVNNLSFILEGDFLSATVISHSPTTLHSKRLLSLDFCFNNSSK